mmetsp:Transcript_88212/g.262988  ORF Transcript_88212/g.262988 Transcript_88212/m.262988 type:complete len:214 (-) Transcript_88212:8-649(-)
MLDVKTGSVQSYLQQRPAGAQGGGARQRGRCSGAKIQAVNLPSRMHPGKGHHLGLRQQGLHRPWVTLPHHLRVRLEAGPLEDLRRVCELVIADRRGTVGAKLEGGHLEQPRAVVLAQPPPPQRQRKLLVVEIDLPRSAGPGAGVAAGPLARGGVRTRVGRRAGGCGGRRRGFCESSARSEEVRDQVSALSVAQQRDVADMAGGHVGHGRGGPP